jgi:hypothetical protein
MARPDDRSGGLREQTATTATKKHESMIESIEAVPFVTKTLTPAAPCPPCTNRPHRTALHRAVPCRAGNRRVLLLRVVTLCGLGGEV